MEEERRVVFVAITRAKYRLFLSCTLEGWSPLVKNLLRKPYVSLDQGNAASQEIDWDTLAEFLDRPLPAGLERDVDLQLVTPPATKRRNNDESEDESGKSPRLAPVTPEKTKKKRRIESIE